MKYQERYHYFHLLKYKEIIWTIKINLQHKYINISSMCEKIIINLNTNKIYRFKIFMPNLNVQKSMEYKKT